MSYDLYVEIRHEDVLVLDDEEREEFQEIFEATPLYCYRNPLNGTTQIQIGFDPSGLDKIHLVFVKYFKQEEILLPRWAIAEVVPSRRCAKQIAEEIEENEWKGDGPWMRDGCIVDDIEIYSLGVED